VCAAYGNAHTFSAAFLINKEKVEFLIDSGAALSIIPIPLAHSLNCIIRTSSVKLRAADGRNLDVKGECSLKLCSRSLRRQFCWTFVLANTSLPIIGADFLSNFELLVDCASSKLIDNNTRLTSSCSTSHSQISLNCTPVLFIPESLPSSVNSLLQKYKSLLSPHQVSHNNTQQNPNLTYHYIETTSNKPVFARARQLSPAKLTIAKQEFDHMLDAGIIRPSNSPWASPLHMVPKSGVNEWRPCGDYRKLNSMTKHDCYPIPNISSLSGILYGKKVFSRLDLVKAFYHIPVADSDIEKTAIITPFGLFEFLVMPFGLRNAAQSFQRHMHSVLRNLPFVFVYIDDILIFSETEEEHMHHLELVFQRLNDYNLHISIEKCIFCVPELDFLGFNLSSQGLLPLKKKILAIQEFEKPCDYARLRRFVGMINFYRKFIPHYANIVEPLYNLLGSTSQRNHPLSWTDDANASFDSIKQALADSTLLHHNSPGRTYHLITDASNVAVGAALHQITDGVSHPIGFFSKRLSSTQRIYSAFDRELLASYLSVLHFKHMIEGKEVHLFTDHKPLVSAFYSQNPAKSDRQQRHLSLIAEYVSSVEFISGSDNIVADAFSRSVSAIEIDFPDLSNIADTQKLDNEIKDYEDRLKSYNIADNKTLLCDTSTMFPRPFLPSNCRKQIFDHLHALSHPGVNGSTKLITARYFWPSMKKDIKTWVKTCLSCQQSKIQRNIKSPVQQPVYPYTDRFQTVHMDIIGPFAPSKALGSIFPSSLRYVVTFIDRATRWFECIPVPDILAETVASAFLSGWISRFGVPLHLVTDQGRQFESELFKNLSTIVGFHRLRTSSYHPQSNGMIERFHRTLKTALKARKDDWLVALPVVQLALRCIPNESSFSPITALTGTTLLTPHTYFETESPSSKQQVEFVKRLSTQMQQVDFRKLSEGIHHSKAKPSNSRVPVLKIGEYVWLRIDRIKRPLEAPYQGPYEIIEFKDKIVKIKTETDKIVTVSIDRIKPVSLLNKFCKSSDDINNVNSNSNKHKVNSNLSPNSFSNNVPRSYVYPEKNLTNISPRKHLHTVSFSDKLSIFYI